jgi:diaminopimelate epimerase
MGVLQIGPKPNRPKVKSAPSQIGPSQIGPKSNRPHFCCLHGGNVHHIYADTELLSARLLIILSMARYSHYLPKSADFNFMVEESK